MADRHDADGHRIKRFKHQSYAEKLKDVHLPSAFLQSTFNGDIEETSSQFHASLEHWTQLNSSSAFLEFVGKTSAMSQSLPLLVHNWQDVLTLWIAAVDQADDDALRVLFDTMQNFCLDLRSTIGPAYDTILERLLRALPKALSPETLTTLLSTFSVLFKLLLVPSIGDSSIPQTPIFDKTWSDLCGVLLSCNTEVQRAMAEVWSMVIRRLQKDYYPYCVRLMIEEQADQGISDVVAWMFQGAMKSVSQTLHTCTASLLEAVLNYHLSSSHQQSEHSEKLLRRILTALIHHCSKPQEFTTVASLLLDSLAVITGDSIESESCRNEKTGRILRLVNIPCSVRKGSRLTDKQLSDLLIRITALEDSSITWKARLEITVAILVASNANLPLWMGPGVHAIDHAWAASPRFALCLSGALAELEWPGFKQFALPHMLKYAKLSMEAEEDLNLINVRLFAELFRKDMLHGDIWAVELASWVRTYLDFFSVTDSSIIMMREISVLAPALPPDSIVPGLLAIIKNVVTADTDTSSKTVANETWVLGLCLRLLARMPYSSDATLHCGITGFCLQIIRSWSLSDFVMTGLVKFLQSRTALDRSALLFLDLYKPLQENLSSHTRSLRQSTLELLQLTSAIPTSSEHILRSCLAAESVPLTVHNVRERIVRISKLGQSIQDDDAVAAELLARWLIGQLKVNLRPIWSPAIDAIASLSERYSTLVWSLIVDGLKASQKTEPEEMHSQDTQSQTLGPQNTVDSLGDSEIREEERSWRDPNAFKLRTVISAWTQPNYSFAKHLTSNDRFDSVNFENQLLNILCRCPALAEKNNRDLVSIFLSFASPALSLKPPRTKLVEWLKLMSKFTNGKALHQSAHIHAIYESYLSHPDRSLQKLSLACLLTFKTPCLLRHEAHLLTLMDDTKWRDEMALLDIDQIEPDERAELIPVLMRIFYGMMLERRGQTKRRATILSALSVCTEEELQLLVDLMLKPFGSIPTMTSDEWTTFKAVDVPSQTQQIGFLMLLGDVIRNLGTRIVCHWPALISATLMFTAHAQETLQAIPQAGDKDVSTDEDDGAEDTEERPQTSERRFRTIRQLGLKRFTDFFRCSISFDFRPFVARAFDACISPRVPLLDKENTQAPSALLELLSVWTELPETAMFLVQFDSRILPKVFDCLAATNVKPAVLFHVLDMVERLLAHAEQDEAFLNNVLRPNVSTLLSDLATLVQRTPIEKSTPFVQRQLAILSNIAPYIIDAEQATILFGLFAPLLQKQHRVVPERIKVDILKILHRLLSLIPEVANIDSKLYQVAFSSFAYSFRTLRGRQARVALVAAFKEFAALNLQLKTVADLIESLNSYSARQVDEPNFDRRLAAFTTINRDSYEAIGVESWALLLCNMLHFVQDENELSIRTNASLTMRRFIEVVSREESLNLQQTFLRILLPGLKRGLHAKNELVVQELLGVISYAVEKCGSFPSLHDMTPLLAGGDEEANFFNNIYHIQVHRRARALRRLVDQCELGQLRSSTLSEIFVPLVDHLITATDHHLVNEAIVSLGHISKRLSWGQYFPLVQRYLRPPTGDAAPERTRVRALTAVLNGFHFPMEEAVEISESLPANGEEDDEGPDVKTVHDSKSVAKISDAVNERLLPSLLKHLEQKDGMEDSNRIPVAIGIVKVAQYLPASIKDRQMTRLFTILSQALRSKSQETRDLTRETLCKIIDNLGISYLYPLVQELRLALVRGPQLHVLAFVVHALLVSLTTADHSPPPVGFDICVPVVVHIAAEVVFGQSDKDVQTEEFRTKVKEVRSSKAKGMDSFAVLARHITPVAVANLLLPLKAIMQETESMRAMQYVDEVLRRIADGINANIHFGPAEVLVLSHTLISQNARFLQQAIITKKDKRKRKDDVIVQTSRQTLNRDNDHYAHNSYRFVCLGLNLFNTSFRKGRFNVREQKVIARLESMVTVLGNSLYSSNGQVVVLGLKAASSIVKCPLPSMNKSLPVFIHHSLSIIRQTGSTDSDLAQAVFKFLAVVIRDCSFARFKEDDLAFLLDLLSPDLEEPTRHASAFTLLRAIISRKFVVPEIYDLMDKVSEIMVTNQSMQVQELCRGVLLQFLLDYPQGKGRLKQHMMFLARNLSYEFESGRKSVMELLHAVIGKFQDDLVEEYADLLFVALVMALANDDSSKCREMAAQLIKSLFGRLKTAELNLMMEHIHSWSIHNDNAPLSRVSSQLYGLIVETLQQDGQQYLSVILEDTNLKLQISVQELNEGGDMNLDWQIPYQALSVITKLFAHFPEAVSTHDVINWMGVAKFLLHPHAWVRTAACRLFGSLFFVVPVMAPDRKLPEHSPFSSAGMKEIAKAFCMQLKSEYLDNALGMQVVKNLFYLGKCFDAIPAVSTDKKTEDISGFGDVEGEEGGGNVDHIIDDSPDEQDNEQSHSKTGSPLAWLFSRLSYQARSAYIARRNRRIDVGNWSEQLLAILRWFAAMTSHMQPEALERYLPHILSPVYRVIEDDTIHDTQMEELKTIAIELQDLVQKRVGTTQFAAVHARIRQRILGVRKERKVARILQTTVHPEYAAKRKVQKNTIKKESRKRKNAKFSEKKYGKRL